LPEAGSAHAQIRVAYERPTGHNVQALKTDLMSIQSKSQISDLLGMEDGATKPSQTSVTKLISQFPTAEFHAVVADAEALLQASSIGKAAEARKNASAINPRWR
jgi:hypothetical protein